jgi:hypothetical protein
MHGDVLLWRHDVIETLYKWRHFAIGNVLFPQHYVEEMTDKFCMSAGNFGLRSYPPNWQYLIT